jgi:dienelactone hydrolase
MSSHPISSSKPRAAQGSEVYTSGDHIAVAAVPQSSPNKRGYLWWARIIFVSILALSALPIAAQDTQPGTFPSLSGEYAVGQIMRAITDPARDEIFTDDTTDKRTLAVTFYYPAEPDANMQPAPYMTEAETQGFAAVMGVPPALTQSLHPNLYHEAPIAPIEGGYPVLLFMPGLGTPVHLYSALLEQIASHGYVVVVVDPVYSSEISFYPDGQYATAVPAGLDVAGDAASNPLIRSWVNDARFVLDWLEEVNISDVRLIGQLDLSRIGMFGHSFGGATALQAAYDDPRIAGAIDMDGRLFGSVMGDELTTPFLIMNSEGSTDLSAAGVSDAELEAQGMTREQLEEAETQNLADKMRLLTVSPTSYQLTIAGTQHNSYVSDLTFVHDLVPQLVTDEKVGTIASTRMLQIQTDYVIAFFDTYVKGGQTALLTDQPNLDYPEVTFGYVSF